MEGKNEYRSSRFAAALDFYERAVERDSALAMAALNGAQAASWLGQLGKAEGLIDVALAYSSYLPAPHRLLARGLHGYLTGAADSAVIWLRRALASDHDWAEAHMALAEVFYHLLPSLERPLDSLAEAELTAAAADSGFSPPLFHLSEIELRRGNLEAAESLVQRYLEFMPESPYRGQLTFMLDCVRRDAGSMDWAVAAAVSPLTVLASAKSLSVAGSDLECARGGFEAVLSNDQAQHLHWGATLGLQGVLMAMGRYEEFFALVDSTIAHRPPTWTLYVLGAMADSQLIPKALEAEQFIQGAFGQEYQSSPSARLSWTMGSWHAYRGDSALSRVVYEALESRSENRQAELLSAGLAAQLTLLRGDTAAAVSQLAALASTARRDSVIWYPAESQPVERLLLAELLVSEGKNAEAIQAASVFDQADPIIYLQYLRASLQVRLRAARQLVDEELETHYVNRLRTLGRTDVLQDINR
jgi:tetratricopeptide (TPR) repeat protein